MKKTTAQLEAIVAKVTQTASLYRGNVTYGQCFYSGFRDDISDIIELLDLDITSADVGDYVRVLKDTTSRPPKASTPSNLLKDMLTSSPKEESLNLSIASYWKIWPSVFLDEVRKEMTHNVRHYPIHDIDSHEDIMTRHDI